MKLYWLAISGSSNQAARNLLWFPSDTKTLKYKNAWRAMQQKVRHCALRWRLSPGISTNNRTLNSVFDSQAVPPEDSPEDYEHEAFIFRFCSHAKAVLKRTKANRFFSVFSFESNKWSACRRNLQRPTSPCEPYCRVVGRWSFGKCNFSASARFPVIPLT